MKLLVLGNALLDMVVSVGPEFLQSYGLIPDSSQTVAENESLKALLAEISKMDKVVIKPGGSALNTVRMTQHLLKTLKVSSVEIVMLGSVGNDRSGQLLIQTVKDEGIQFVAQTVENVATGRCACLLTHGGTARTMVTDLGASLNFENQIWKNMSGSRELLEETDFLYISGYFLKVSPQTVMDTVRAVKTKSVPILLNLNAVWVSSVCKEGLEQILPDVNVLFGNEQEIRSFAKELSPQLSNFDSMTAAEISFLLVMVKRKNIMYQK